MDVFIGIGSNLGEREKNIQIAIEGLRKIRAVKVEKVSSLIETEALGGPSQPKYLNGALKVKTDLLPSKLLEILQRIEKKMGRVRKVKNEPRTIDLDILLYGDKVINEPNLKVPHPRMRERDFVLKPLLELEPAMVKQLKIKNEK